ncbi:MAG: hypothetical protein HKN61_04335 [Flavobacteriaceae bacterium]|nr:hypothetical protein [Flavobacteriaceae bacterium]
METYKYIKAQLNRFMRRYYLRMIVKGIILSTVLVLLYLLLVMGLEYFLWLNTVLRSVLFWGLVLLTTGLLLYYVLTPLMRLLKIQKGITEKDASRIIGQHFTAVGDKLVNLLDLVEDDQKSELLIASIEQRSAALKHVPFQNALEFRKVYRNAKYLLIPLLIGGVIWLSGNLDSFTDSYKRVVDYATYYEPPAPFVFVVQPMDLNVLKHQPVRIEVTTEGELRPENMFLVLNGRNILMQEENGIYTYTLKPPQTNSSFYFTAGGIRSEGYEIKALDIPEIQDFSLQLFYPKYLDRENELIRSTGNARIPEGTMVEWDIRAEHTDDIQISFKDTLAGFNREADRFNFKKRIFRDSEYRIVTSNANVDSFEELEYSLEIVPDAYPQIEVSQQRDSINPQLNYFMGKVSDDHGLKELGIVYYPVGQEDIAEFLVLEQPSALQQDFFYMWPSGLKIQEGITYELYFSVKDNDGIRNGKTSKSRVFSLKILGENEITDKRLEQQNNTIQKLGKTLENLKDQREVLEELNNQQKEKDVLEFNDQQKITEFLKKQEQQEEMMGKFSRELKDNLQSLDKDDDENRLLQERLERQEMMARKNERLLEELGKVADKIEKEDLQNRLEELAKDQKNNARSLEQLLELTKRYYVTEKAAQLGFKIEKQAEEQQDLSISEKQADSLAALQEELNKDFIKTALEMDSLNRDNQELKKPLDLPFDNSKQEDIKKDQEDALDKLRSPSSEDKSAHQDDRKKAAQKQKSAAEKLREMAESLQKAGTAGGGSEGMAEDAEMLRQILDNLVSFSFKQERLYDALSQRESDLAPYGELVKDQQELQELFTHVDDSLFALSLRRSELSEFVNEQIGEVYYNMDKTLVSLAETQVYQGASYQQYVITAANSLADFLANILENMQQSLQQGPGSGSQEGGFQLPDIIKGQGELQQQMGQVGSKGKGQQGEGKEPGEGQEGNEQGKGQGKDGKGKNGNGENGSGEGEGNGEGDGGESGQGASEQSLEEIYEIYKQQQRLRQQLERQLDDMIGREERSLTQRLLRQMEDFENDLLENGITERGMNKVNMIKQQLLKLENAALEQGEKQERESNSNKQVFDTPITTRPRELENYSPEIEILNRQALPLRENLKIRIKEYFKANDRISLPD